MNYICVLKGLILKKEKAEGHCIPKGCWNLRRKKGRNPLKGWKSVR